MQEYISAALFVCVWQVRVAWHNMKEKPAAVAVQGLSQKGAKTLHNLLGGVFKKKIE